MLLLQKLHFNQTKNPAPRTALSVGPLVNDKFAESYIPDACMMQPSSTSSPVYDAIVMMMTMMIASAYYAIVIIMIIINIRVQCSRHDDDHPKVTLGFLRLSILNQAPSME